MYESPNTHEPALCIRNQSGRKPGLTVGDVVQCNIQPPGKVHKHNHTHTHNTHTQRANANQPTNQSNHHPQNACPLLAAIGTARMHCNARLKANISHVVY